MTRKPNYFESPYALSHYSPINDYFDLSSDGFAESVTRSALMEERFVALVQDTSSTLGEFGKFARMLFCAGIQLWAEGINSKASPKAKSVYQKAHAVIDMESIRRLGFRGSYTRRSVPASDLVEVYLPDLKKIFKEMVENDPKIPSTEKVLWKKAVSFAQKRGELSRSGLITAGKIAWASSRSLGQLYDTILASTGGSKVSLGDAPVSADSLKMHYSNWRRAVKALTGESRTGSVPTIVLQDAKGTKKDQYVQLYRSSRREIKNASDIMLRNITSGGPIPVDEAAKKFKSAGFQEIPFVTGTQGFVGLVGSVAGRIVLYTTSGSALKGGISPGSKVTMNKNYDSETETGYYVSFVAPNAVGATRIYTEKRSLSNQTKKFDNVVESASQIKRWVNAWTRDMKSTDVGIRSPATAAMILYMTGARVGSSTSNRSLKGAAQTYGIISLKKQHIKITPASIIISYLGKKGQKQREVISLKNKMGRMILANLEPLLDGKKPDDLVWSWKAKHSPRGRVEVLTYAKFVKYCKSVGLQKVHSLRHIRGTTLVSDLLVKNPYKPKRGQSLRDKQKAAEAHITRIIEEAGRLLGHKSNSGGTVKVAWKTTATSYIRPAVMHEYFTNLELEVPKWVPSMK